jgi:hypothetical protein
MFHRLRFVPCLILLMGCVEVGEDSETGCLVDMTGPGCQPDAGMSSAGAENALGDPRVAERE